MKKMFGIIGIGLVVGVITYVIWNKAQNVKEDDANVTADKEDASDSTSEKSDLGDIHQNGEVEEELIIAKKSSEDVIATRHEEAAKIMRDAVDIICKRSEVPEDENNELEQISDELDKLMNEE